MMDFDALSSSGLQDVNSLITAINFIGCAVLSLLLRAFYVRYSTSVSSKNHLGSILPLLSLIVFLVIVVVKSSLALSLGLVGALSIVRFRTPIKEPEELVYLFLAIAIGLGFGAGFTLLTIAASISILLFARIFLASTKYGVANEYNLVATWTDQGVEYPSLFEAAFRSSSDVRLLRLSEGPNGKSCVLQICPEKHTNITDVIDDIRKVSPAVDIELFEATTNW